VRRIYEAKGRPLDNPMIVHVADMAGARKLAAKFRQRLKYSPKSSGQALLTIVLPKSKNVPYETTAA